MDNSLISLPEITSTVHNIFPKPPPAIIAMAVFVPLVVLVAGCASSRTVHKKQAEMPVLILVHSDGSEDWGRVMLINDDSLRIRRLEDLEPYNVDAADIIDAYRVERKPPNYLLSFGASTLMLAGGWGIVVGVNGGDTSAGSFLIAGAVGVIPAALVGMQVSDWSRHYKITPLNVNGPNGRLDLKQLRIELALPFSQDESLR